MSKLQSWASFKDCEIPTVPIQLQSQMSKLQMIASDVQFTINLYTVIFIWDLTSEF